MSCPVLHSKMSVAVAKLMVTVAWVVVAIEMVAHMAAEYTVVV